MIKFEICTPQYQSDLMELIRPFESRLQEDLDLRVDYVNEGNAFVVRLQCSKPEGFFKQYVFPFDAKDDLECKRLEKRYLKIAIYRTLNFVTGISLPYGCLTGIRPSKLFVELEKNAEQGGESAREIFLSDYSVSEGKVNLVEQVVNVQRKLRNHSSRAVDVFVFVPFCPTKCAYCSFVSLPLDKTRKLLEPYIDLLIEEIENTRRLIAKKRMKVRAVYIGGGTPTSIGAQLLDKLLSHCHFACNEFTVEAGRPDTIDEDIVAVLQKHGVSRISVNPQTFNDKTLERIGRAHKSADIYKAFALVKGKFDVNMDLIATLPGESFEDFKRSVDIAVAMSPENITVHTLYLKKGSALKLSHFDNTDYETACQMVDYAYCKLSENGYQPYYMYRQKYTSGNLENVGYAKKGKECIYNIDIMEEDTSIFANGAGAISKKWTKRINLIQRCANFKDPLEYVKHFDLMLQRQNEFWEGASKPSKAKSEDAPTLPLQTNS